MASRMSPLRRGAGLLLIVCGAIAALDRPGLSAPAGRVSRPKWPAQAAVAAPKAPLPAVPPPGNRIMPVSEVRPGMKGYGLTVFRGTAIERFDVTVVDVL